MIIPKGVLKILMETFDKKHVEPFCKGIHVFASGYVAATDGNVAFVSNKLDMKDTHVFEDILISVGTIAMSGIETLVLDPTKSCLIGLDKHSNVVSMFPYVKEQNQPFDFRNIYLRHVPNTSGSITLDPKYMKRIASVFPDNTDVYLKVGKENTPSIAIGEQGALIIMPKKEKPRTLPEILLGNIGETYTDN